MLTLKNNTVSFQIKYDCNKRCNYCSLDKEKYVFSDRELIKNFHNIFHKINIYMKGIGKDIVPSIVGGEPTYWSYEFQEAILNEIKDCKKYLLFTNGFDMSAPLYKDEKAIPYIHIIDYTDLDKVSFILDKIKETNKKEWYVCIVIPHGYLEHTKAFLKYMKDKALIRHVYLQPCDHKEAYLHLSQEEQERLYNFCKEEGFINNAEEGLDYKLIHLLSPSTYINCWENRSLYVDLIKNTLSCCDHWTYPESLDSIYDIDSYIKNKKIPCIDSNCQSPIHCNL